MTATINIHDEKRNVECTKRRIRSKLIQNYNSTFEQWQQNQQPHFCHLLAGTRILVKARKCQGILYLQRDPTT